MGYDIFMGETASAEDEARIAQGVADIQAERAAEAAKAAKRAKCSRCRGTGFIPAYHYNDNGRCFSCN